MADIKKLLLNNMSASASSSQAPYVGLSQEIKSNNQLSDECSKIAINALLQILKGAEKDSIDGLKTRLERVRQLEGYIKEADVGPEETAILNGLVAKVKTAISKHLQDKRSLLSRAAKLIDASAVDIGGLLNAMSKNDPLMRMVVAGGGAIASKIKKGISARQTAKSERRQALYEDANQMRGSVLIAEQKAREQQEKQQIAEQKAQEKAQFKEKQQLEKEQAKAEKQRIKAEEKRAKEEEKEKIKKKRRPKN